ncbi:MAG: MBL fold metallo-hydrolase [Candidatus Micrarchaeota archaeon]
MAKRKRIKLLTPLALFFIVVIISAVLWIAENFELKFGDNRAINAISINSIFGIFNVTNTNNANNAFNSTLEIHFLNVSQGDSIFFRTGDYTMLVDCGTSNAGDKIIGYLTNLSVWKLDYLIITHTDFDHIGGCAEILQKFYVKNVIMDGQKRNNAVYNKTIAYLNNKTLIIPKKYEIYQLNNARMKILHANTGSEQPNQNSIVFMLYFGDFKLLMDADCDGECERSLLSENIDADVLKVAHHGSKFASSTEFLNRVTPTLAIIEVGENNYGHPDDGTLTRLRIIGAEILRTDLNGTIILKTNGSGYYK